MISIPIEKSGSVHLTRYCASKQSFSQIFSKAFKCNLLSFYLFRGHMHQRLPECKEEMLHLFCHDSVLTYVHNQEKMG